MEPITPKLNASICIVYKNLTVDFPFPRFNVCDAIIIHYPIVLHLFEISIGTSTINVFSYQAKEYLCSSTPFVGKLKLIV